MCDAYGYWNQFFFYIAISIRIEIVYLLTIVDATVNWKF